MTIRSYSISQPNEAKTGLQHIKAHDNIWVDLTNANSEEETAVESRYGVNIINEFESRSLEDSAKFFIENQNIYLGISIPARFEGQKPSQLGHKRSFLGFIVTAKTLITFHETALRALEVGSSRSNTRLVGVTSPQDALLVMLESIIERQADLLSKIGFELDTVSLPTLADKKIVKAEPRLKKLGQLGAALALCRDCLSDLGRLFNYLLPIAGEKAFDAKKLKSYLADVTNLQRQYEAQSSDLTFLLDATLGLISARQSKALNFIAVVTLLFAPPTLIAGIFGMNFGNWKFFDLPHGHEISFALMLLSGVFVLGIAKIARLF